MSIKISFESGEQVESRAAIVVPEAALADATYIRFFTVDSPAQSKHEFHAMAQIALIQFDDEELVPEKVAGAISLSHDGETFSLESGIMLCRLVSDALVIYINDNRSFRKYLEIAYRYCTRWVRLDI